MKQNQIVNGRDFLKLLAKQKGNLVNSPMVVQGDIGIYSKEFELETINLQGITFNGMVTVRGFKKILLSFDSSNFLGGLSIEQNAGQHICIASAKAMWVNLWHCQFESVFLCGIETDSSLDISGLQLSKGLTLDECNFSELELIHNSTEDSIKTPWVKTNDPIVAKQFQLIGVPVFMSTEAVRAMMKNEMEKKAFTT